jgi:16S rRNA (cytidine1402-2'-O)-methyltransferase
MALISSGLNGQKFAFHGYLPKKQPERGVKLKQLESESYKENQTQLFIETPYRNDAIMQDILSSCRPETMLCIASDISLSTEFIKTMSVKDWRNVKRSFNDHPAVFAIGAPNNAANRKHH